MIAAIVAMAHGRVIGAGNDLPWYLPADLKRFKQLTTGHTVIMGRKTADSIVARLGHGLPDRRNIVITREATYADDDFIVVHSVDEALEKADGDVFIIGGEQIFRLALSQIDTLHITEVDADIKGDVYFPVYDVSQWREVAREHHDADDKNPYAYDFVELQRAV